jgi:hypothetical protein
MLLGIVSSATLKRMFYDVSMFGDVVIDLDCDEW